MNFKADDIQFNTMGLMNQNVATVVPSAHLSSMAHTNGQNTYQYNTALGSQRGQNADKFGASPSGIGSVKASNNIIKQKKPGQMSQGNHRAHECQPGQNFR